MFDTYVLDRRGRSSRGGWFATSLVFGTTVVGGIMVALVVYSYWQITRVSPKYQAVSFLPVAPPPEPPAAAAAPPPIANKDATRDPVDKDKDKTKIELVQLDKDVKADLPKDQGATPAGDPNGVPGGKEGGKGTDPDGDLNGDPNGVPHGTGTVAPIDKIECIGAECDPKPVKIEMKVMSARRIAGREQIPLSNEVKLQAVRDNKLQFMIGVKLCLDKNGAPAKIELQGSSGYPEADAAVLAEMQNWRFQPYTVDGKPVPVCAGYIYQYQIGK